MPENHNEILANLITQEIDTKKVLAKEEQDNLETKLSNSVSSESDWKILIEKAVLREKQEK